MSDQSEPTQEELTNGILAVKASDARSVILRELLRGEFQRPVDFKDAVMEESGTSQANVYDSLNTLNEKGVVEKMSGDSKTTLYSVTELGEAVADKLGISPTEEPEPEDGTDPSAEAEQESVPDAGGHPLDSESGDPKAVAYGAGEESEGDEQREHVDELKKQIREVVDEQPEQQRRAALQELAEEYDANE